VPRFNHVTTSERSSVSALSTAEAARRRPGTIASWPARVRAGAREQPLDHIAMGSAAGDREQLRGESFGDDADTAG
jgi:hypothetical protein